MDSYIQDAITTLKDCRPHSQTFEEFRDALINAEARVADVRNAWVRGKREVDGFNETLEQDFVERGGVV